MTSPTNAKKNIYFLGIAGTGMASAAGLLQSLGHKISGSDQEIYPPMSDMLADLAIPVMSPYSANNLESQKPDLVIVANALSRGNVEIEAMINQNIPYTSFPQILGDEILSKRCSIVVSGTHGKTTTCSLFAHILNELGLDPGFLIGGIPRNFPLSFRLGGGPCFITEGDEYDTAFFDKGPKFLHYAPRFLIINNVEFDHADIYKNASEIETQFAKLCDLVPEKDQIIANADDPGVMNVLKLVGLENKVSLVATKGQRKDGVALKVLESKAKQDSSGEGWEVTWDVEGKIQNFATTLLGDHNASNIAMVYACMRTLEKKSQIPRFSEQQFSEALRSFKGVKRRMDLLGKVGDIDVYEDFAHHPTAISTVIQGFRKSHPHRRLLVAFEPRNATSRRNVFQQQFAQALKLADLVFIGKCPVDQRIPDDQRMNTKAMRDSIGTKALSFDTNEELLEAMVKKTQPGDSLLFMSSSSFSGVQHRASSELSKKLNMKA